MTEMTKKNDPSYPNPYASGGLRTTMSDHTEGKRYRVRNADGPDKIWGQNLDYLAAHKLKERIAGQRKSKNPIIEDMAIPFPPIVQQLAPVHAPPAPSAGQPPADPDLRAAWDAGMAAARGAAAEAQARADASRAAAAAMQPPADPPSLPDLPPGEEMSPGEIDDLLADDGGLA